MNPTIPLLAALGAVLFATSSPCQSLPGTQALAPHPDRSAAMVEGIDRMALRLIGQSKGARRPTREKLKAAIGLVDGRLPVSALDLVGDTTSPPLLHETDRCRVFRVRWPVLDGVHGEGIYLQPKSLPLARVVCLPDADAPPETLVNSRWVVAGCEVVIPALLSRGSDFSRTGAHRLSTNVSHREWIYRQSYQLGRHPIGYEVEQVLAVVDWFKAQPEQVPVIVAGTGEGGLMALYVAAVDERIEGGFSAGYFGPRESVWEEPIERNIFGLLRDFGDAEIASLIAPRPLVLMHADYPGGDSPKAAAPGARDIAAPGKLVAPGLGAWEAEVGRTRSLAPASQLLPATEETSDREILRHLLPDLASGGGGPLLTSESDIPPIPPIPVDTGRQERLVRQLGDFSQRQIVTAEREREGFFWRALPLDSAEEYAAHTARERERFWNEIVGRLPDPDRPAHPKSRLVRETGTVVIHEVTLDVWDDVFAWGWLCLPKDLKPGERRPVVVCQHGLEGLPEDTFNEDRSSRAWASYKAFALRLAEEGFVVFAPHNPYRGKDAFRTLQRKLNPLGLSLYSVIYGQHQRVLEWLKAQPFAQPDKIAFYGLSYGGRSAVTIPAVLTDYCLSISSANFNEWIRYTVSSDLSIPGYIHAPEYEIWDWNLARNFNYAEMTALIAPRPFMVERGHDDGSGTDEWVDYEYAKVRRLYNKLGLGDRTAIEHFDGPHTIHGVGSFRFLKEKLGWK